MAARAAPGELNEFPSAAVRRTMQKKVDNTDGSSAAVARALKNWKDAILFLTDPEADLSRIKDLSAVHRKIFQFQGYFNGRSEENEFKRIIRWHLCKIWGLGKHKPARLTAIPKKFFDRVVKDITHPKRNQPEWTKVRSNWGILANGGVMDRRALRMAIEYYVLKEGLPDVPATLNRNGSYHYTQFPDEGA